MKRQARIPRRTMAYHRRMELAGIHMEELILRDLRRKEVDAWMSGRSVSKILNFGQPSGMGSAAVQRSSAFANVDWSALELRVLRQYSKVDAQATVDMYNSLRGAYGLDVVKVPTCPATAQ